MNNKSISLILLLYLMIFINYIKSFKYIRPLNILNHNKLNSLSLKNEQKINNETITYDLVLSNPLKVSVFVDPLILNYINISDAYRKKTLNLPKRFVKDQLTVDYLIDCINKLIPELSSHPYILRYYYNKNLFRRRFEDDNEVYKAIQAINNGESFQLFVDINPFINFPPIDSLIGIPDHLESDTLTMLSFYKFVNISEPVEAAYSLEYVWKRLGVFGRVYVASEGINAQVAIPTNMLDLFKKKSLEEFPNIFQNELYLNIDHTLTRDQYEITKPFKSLHIRVRDQIVADGYLNNPDKSIDWSNGGREMPPIEWHKALDNPEAIVLDCRNSYETDVGLFDKAIPLNTTFFRDSWEILDEILDSKPKDTPILTYCTGGIRCVKINAYIEQKLGFQNVNRLQGGIIAYSRELEQLNKNIPINQPAKSLQDLVEVLPSHHLDRNVVESKFKGTNYVFDERMGTKITNDVLSNCETCGTTCDLFTNCNNFDCHVRFIQCGNCKSKYDGCCSMYCKKSYDDIIASKNDNKLSIRKKAVKVFEINDSVDNRQVSIKEDRNKDDRSALLQHANNANELIESINTYCEKHSTEESNILKQLREETNNQFTIASRMLSSSIQGQLLTFLSTIHKPKNILELGTFTGYATICLAGGIKDLLESKVYSCDIDINTINLANKFIGLSELNNKIEIHNKRALDMISYARENSIKFDMAFIDADKKQYQNYLVELMGYEYISNENKYIKSKNSLLNNNAIIIVDNTLWKGLVLQHEETLANSAPDPSLYGEKKRMEAMALSIHTFNTFINTFPKLLQVIMLPLRDGLTIIRYSDIIE